MDTGTIPKKDPGISPKLSRVPMYVGWLDLQVRLGTVVGWSA